MGLSRTRWHAPVSYCKMDRYTIRHAVRGTVIAKHIADNHLRHNRRTIG